MALKWGSNYPTHIKFNNNNVDEVKQNTTTVWTRPIFSFSDVYWLYNSAYFTITPGYNDSTHRSAYSNPVAFFKDTVSWEFSDSYFVIDYANKTVINGPGNSVAWNGEFYYIDRPNDSFTINKAKMDDGVRSSNSSIPLGWHLYAGTPPTLQTTTITRLDDWYSAYTTLWLHPAADQAPLDWDCYITIPNCTAVVDGTLQTGYSYTYYAFKIKTTGLAVTDYEVEIPLEDDNTYLVKAEGKPKLDIVGYSVTDNVRAIITNFTRESSSALSFTRPGTTIGFDVSANYYADVNGTVYFAYTALDFRIIRKAISKALGKTSNALLQESYVSWTDVEHKYFPITTTQTAYPLDTYQFSVTCSPGFRLKSGTYTSNSGQTYTKSGTYGHIIPQVNTFEFEAIPYTLTMAKGTGISATKVTISRGEIGKHFKSLSDVSNGTSSSYTVYYGDMVTGYSATANTGYTAPSATTGLNYTITGNKTFTQTATATKYKLTLSAAAGTSSIQYKITKRGSHAPSGSTVHSGWQTYSSPIELYYNDEVTYHGLPESGYTQSADKTVAVTSTRTVSVTCSPAKYTLTLSKGNAAATLYYKISSRGSIANSNGYAGQVDSTWKTYSSAISNLFYGDKVDYYASTTTTGYSNSDSQTVTMTATRTITVNAKPTAYSFVISQASTGVSVIYTTITRGTIGKTYAGASDITQSMNQTFTCYYGDTYSITANVSTGYVTGSANTSGTITGNKTLTLAATPTVYKLTLTKGTGASTLYYKITKRGNRAPSGSATHTTWQTYSSAVNIYYGDTVAYYAVGKTGYNNTSEATATVSGNITQTLTCTAKTVTLTVPYGTTWTFKATVTRGTVAKEQGKSNESFNGSTGGGMKAFTCYYGDTYSVEFTSTTAGKWAQKATGTIYTSGVTVSSPSFYRLPTVTVYGSDWKVTYSDQSPQGYLQSAWIKLYMPSGYRGQYTVKLAYYYTSYNSNSSALDNNTGSSTINYTGAGTRYVGSGDTGVEMVSGGILEMCANVQILVNNTVIYETDLETSTDNLEDTQA